MIRSILNGLDQRFDSKINFSRQRFVSYFGAIAASSLTYLVTNVTETAANANVVTTFKFS